MKLEFNNEEEKLEYLMNGIRNYDDVIKAQHNIKVPVFEPKIEEIKNDKDFFIIKTANECLEIAKLKPIPKSLYSTEPQGNGARQCDRWRQKCRKYWPRLRRICIALHAERDGASLMASTITPWLDEARARVAKLRRAFDRRRRRERLLLIGAAIAVVSMLANTLWVAPALNDWSAAQTRRDAALAVVQRLNSETQQRNAASA